MIIEPTSGVGGAWVKKADLKNGDIVKLTSEALWIEGTNGKQLVAKMRVKGQVEDKNLAINTPSRNALCSAFGKASATWVDKHLKVAVESGIFAGKRGIMLNLIPEGYELTTDAGGYITIEKVATNSDGSPVPNFDVKHDEI